MSFPTGLSRPMAVLAWLAPALVVLAACSQTKVSAPSGPAQEPLPARAVAASEPAVAAPPREDRGPAEAPAGDGRAPSSGLRAGLLLPLSGPEAALGRSMLDAAQLALFETAGEGFTILPHDTRGTPRGAEAAARAAVDDGASILLGPVFADSVAAVAPIARDAGINVIAFSNDRSVAGRGTFLMGILPRQQISRVVRYARGQGIPRFAALVPDTAFGRRVARYFERSVRETGGTLVRVERVKDRAEDAAAAVRRLVMYDERRAALAKRRAAIEAAGRDVAAPMMAALENVEGLTDPGFDALLVALSGVRLAEVAARLPYYDVDTARIKVLGLSSWHTDALGREPALVGAWYAAPSIEALGDFETRYRRTFGAAPVPLANLAYDAAALAAALARAGAGPDFTLAALTDASGFMGAAGIFRFRESGESERGLSVFEIGAKAPREIGRAPETFEALVN